MLPVDWTATAAAEPTILRMSLPCPSRRPRHMREIAREVAEAYEVTVEDLRGRVRTRNIVLARHAAMYRMRMEAGRSYQQIGGYLNRDHTTVMSGIRAHAARHGLPIILATNGRARGGPDA